MKRLALHSRTALSLVTLSTLVVSACAERTPRLHASHSLSERQDQPAPRIQLGETTLTTQAEFDAFIKSYLGRRSVEGLLAALTLLADKAQAGSRDQDALLLQRIAVLHLERLRQPGHSQKLLDMAMRLERDAPQSPHTLFLNGFIPYVGLGGERERGPVLSLPENADMVRVIEQHWGRLLELAPDYVGPNGLTAADIRQALNWLSQAQKPPAEKPLVASAGRPPHALSSAELNALAELARFEQSADGARRSLCRDWKRQRKVEEQELPLLRLDLACAIQERQLDEAWELMRKLEAEDGAAFDLCGAWLRLEGQVGQQAVAGKQASSPQAQSCP